MKELEHEGLRWIFLHTAAYTGDAGVDEIREWHLSREPVPFDDIGYHFVVRRDGEIENGRSLQYVGAHVQGANSRSLGICFEGDGDSEVHSGAQRTAGLKLIRTLMKQYNIPVEGVLGHREVNRLIDEGKVGDDYRTTKTCPGKRIDMGVLRDQLRMPHALPEAAVADRLEPKDVAREYTPKEVG